MGRIITKNQTAPSTPDSGYTSLYVDSADKHLKQKDDTGSVTDLTTASGAVQTSTFDTKGDLLVGTADNAYDNLVISGTNGRVDLRTDSSASTGLAWQALDNSRYKLTAAGDDYTVNLATDQVVLTYGSEDIDITFPESTGIPNDGYGKEFAVVHLGTGTCTIKLSGSDYFPNGLTQFKCNPQQSVRIAGSYPNLASGWALMSTHCIFSKSHRTGTWTSGNYSSATACPFTAWVNSDENVVECETNNPTKITFKKSGNAKVGFSMAIESTGGSTWRLRAYIRINGNTVISETDITTGNYGGEDNSLTSLKVPYNFSANDYVELILDHTNLTGYVYDVSMIAETEL